MRKFVCCSCDSFVYFENVACLTCGHMLGYSPDRNSVLTLAFDADGTMRPLGEATARPLRYCANAEHGVCNWLTDADDANQLCAACDLNRTIPNLSEAGSLEAWRALERAKKHLVYSIQRLGLPLDASATGHGHLQFDFVRNAPTGHLDGVITIDVMETDAVERERQRQQFDEPYRTLLGHLRHETGHFYWRLLVAGGNRIEAFRALFGDERQDYAAALATHHASGPPPDWQANHLSAYASAHPAEDWAETWAHYLHMVDAVETAQAEGLEPHRALGVAAAGTVPTIRDVYRATSFDILMQRWIPLALAMNALCRSLGLNDFYPFVISAVARDKLAFVHDAVRDLPKAPRS